MDEVENKYRSRKFIITLLGLGIGIVMAHFNKLTPELSNIILAALTSYNIANAWVEKK